MGYFIGLFTAFYPTLCIKKNVLTKIPLNFYSLKDKKIAMIVSKNESARVKQPGGASNAPPFSSLFRVKPTLLPYLKFYHFGVKHKINMYLAQGNVYPTFIVESVII